MPDSEPTTGGLSDTVRRLGDTVLGLLQNRLQLFSVELQEEKHRWMRLGVWFGAVVALCTVALAMLVLTLAVVAWQLGQIVGLIGLSLILLAAAGIAYWQFHKRFKQGPAPFSATLDEFKKDREWLRGQKMSEHGAPK
ncbi:MAG TPA: phage holin family protein [Candidatus Paceibacterota bacterium]|nr:phage holin family protein [Verrucomicrobiota bacterium]HRY48151.1 phage holin family protein [Candidatus Paceibacterota bacterium]HSA00361.1 phage holin family protein [Candidatus Paceibacterota bacterium]